MRLEELMMREALLEARCALDSGELPVGAIIAKGNEIIARAHNEREETHDPTAHAEILAIRRAAQIVRDWRLTGCTLYVTLEPCPMCAGAIVGSRLARVIYGAYDKQAGCTGSLYRLTEDSAFNHYAPATGGVLETECSALLNHFFRHDRRAMK